jgi:hypothetical protein
VQVDPAARIAGHDADIVELDELFDLETPERFQDFRRSSLVREGNSDELAHRTIAWHANNVGAC